jgi:hypothetical protein
MIALQVFGRPWTQRNFAVLAKFGASNKDGSRLQIDVSNLEPDRLGNSKSAGVNEVKKREVHRLVKRMAERVLE